MRSFKRKQFAYDYFMMFSRIERIMLRDIYFARILSLYFFLFSYLVACVCVTCSFLSQYFKILAISYQFRIDKIRNCFIRRRTDERVVFINVHIYTFVSNVVKITSF